MTFILSLVRYVEKFYVRETIKQNETEIKPRI